MDNDAYQEVTDPSAYVKFKLTDSAIKKLLSSDLADLSSFEKLENDAQKKAKLPDLLLSLDDDALDFASQLSFSGESRFGIHCGLRSRN